MKKELKLYQAHIPNKRHPLAKDKYYRENRPEVTDSAAELIQTLDLSIYLSYLPI